MRSNCLITTPTASTLSLIKPRHYSGELSQGLWQTILISLSNSLADCQIIIGKCAAIALESEGTHISERRIRVRENILRAWWLFEQRHMRILRNIASVSWSSFLLFLRSATHVMSYLMNSAKSRRRRVCTHRSKTEWHLSGKLLEGSK